MLSALGIHFDNLSQLPNESTSDWQLQPSSTLKSQPQLPNSSFDLGDNKDDEEDILEGEKTDDANNNDNN
ncbi:hypothetical protein BLA29_003584, partial [Euroglyphus maynei]